MVLDLIVIPNNHQWSKLLNSWTAECKLLKTFGKIFNFGAWMKILVQFYISTEDYTSFVYTKLAHNYLTNKNK